ncbi:hypothetical protein [Anaerotignum sp.]
MKRIKYACLEQTLHFFVQDSSALRTPKDEFELYKKGLERNKTAYKVLSEETQPDGSLIVKLKKQYNTYDYGSYMD